MFGYIVVNQPEMKVKDYEQYRAYYCGVCHSLKKRFGPVGQLTLSYDMTFLSILLNCLYESAITDEAHSCVMHPGKKHRMLFNQISDYAADMGILLSYYNLKDDWKDDHNLKSYALMKSLKKSKDAVEKHYKRQGKAVREYVYHLTARELAGSPTIDEVAGLTGTMLAEIFVYKEDEWSEELRRIGFFLGKFIYLMDAYEDIEEDKKSGNYNPWCRYVEQKRIMGQEYQDGEFDREVKRILTMMMSECAKAFELLPVVKDIEILRNILFAGVWTKYEMIKTKREKDKIEHDSRTI